MFDSSIKFKYPWRPYQARTLEQIEKYINDKKLHIVAAPGSGKTVLGLELARFLNQPVIMFSPTVTIKNQWVDRFMSSFTNFKEIPDWISSNIYDLKFFNVATYQALHYAYKRKKFQNDIDDDETDDVIEDINNVTTDEFAKTYDIVAELKNKNIKTVILDEAHHLKAEWWNSLQLVLSELPDITIIALTATPPYDSEMGEWKKYISLCGEIDAEINVPELVKAKNLCPHQDYIYFNFPTLTDQHKIYQYTSELNYLIADITNNTGFQNIIKTHRFVVAPYANQEDLLDNVEFYSSMLIFLNAIGYPISKEHLTIIGADKKIPDLDLKWYETLLKNLLLTDRKNLTQHEAILKVIETHLKNLGALEKNTLSLSENKKLQKYFLNSVGKLNSISEIYKIESSSLKEDLRMVVLTDFIRKEYLTDTNSEVDKLGVLPIFKKLYTEHPEIKMAVLTGTLFIVPSFLELPLRTLCKENNIEDDKITFEKLNLNTNYSEVKISNSLRSKVMNLICNLFAKGEVNVIVGTKSLLGEGWDEPSINTLVLASFVGSFMLSNQMRGRAIRVNDNPNKTANIWHLVCVNNPTEQKNILNSDYELLKRRFKAFPGLSYNELTIKFGLSRVGKINEPFNEDNISKTNSLMISKATNRIQMLQDWENAVSNNDVTAASLTSKVEMTKESKLKKVSSFENKFGLLEFFFILSVIFCFGICIGEERVIPSLLIINLIWLLLIILKHIRNYIRKKPKNMLKRVGGIVLNSLCDCGYVKTPKRRIKLISNETDYGLTTCHITGATLKESNIFATALSEVFDPISNPRYILARLTKHGKDIKDYYAVPNLLATNKESAQVFSNYWRKKIGNHTLIYTRTAEGRKKLLKIRMKNIPVFK